MTPAYTIATTVHDLQSAIDAARRLLTMAEADLIYARHTGAEERIEQAKDKLREAAKTLNERSEK